MPRIAEPSPPRRFPGLGSVSDRPAEDPGGMGSGGATVLPGSAPGFSPRAAEAANKQPPKTPARLPGQAESRRPRSEAANDAGMSRECRPSAAEARRAGRFRGGLFEGAGVAGGGKPGCGSQEEDPGPDPSRQGASAGVEPHRPPSRPMRRNSRSWGPR